VEKLERRRKYMREYMREYSKRPEYKAHKAEYDRDYRRTNTERIRTYKQQYDREHREENTERMRTWRTDSEHQTSISHYARKAKYGIMRDEYESMLVEQEGCCLICGQLMHPPCIDHDHDTDEVRGLLCVRCNTMLGMALDNPDILRSGASYLEG